MSWAQWSHFVWNVGNMIWIEDRAVGEISQWNKLHDEALCEMSSFPGKAFFRSKSSGGLLIAGGGGSKVSDKSLFACVAHLIHPDLKSHSNKPSSISQTTLISTTIHSFSVVPLSYMFAILTNKKILKITVVVWSCVTLHWYCTQWSLCFFIQRFYVWVQHIYSFDSTSVTFQISYLTIWSSHSFVNLFSCALHCVFKSPHDELVWVLTISLYDNYLHISMFCNVLHLHFKMDEGGGYHF